LTKTDAHKADCHFSNQLDPEGVRLATSLLETNQRNMFQRESQAEQRVRFFLTIGTGSIGFLAIVPKLGALPGVDWHWVTLAVLVVLLLFGLETVQSMNWKQIYTRVDVKLANSVLATMSGKYPFVADYLEIIGEATHRIDHPNTTFRRALWRLRGSLSEFMYISNALIASGIIMTLAWGIGVLLTAILCVATFFTFAWGQYFYSQLTRETIPKSWA
jgi:hypothetical protein